MTKKRLIIDDDYNWVDTVTNTVIEVEDAFDLVNELWEENEQLTSDLEYWKTLAEGLTKRVTGNKHYF